MIDGIELNEKDQIVCTYCDPNLAIKKNFLEHIRDTHPVQFARYLKQRIYR